MVSKQGLRPNEIAVEWTERVDAALVFIGVIRTPWTSLAECPHSGSRDGPVCRIEVNEPWVAALDGIEAYDLVEVFY
jgi:tRNA (adenine37-N6)-methyltransferase